MDNSTYELYIQELKKFVTTDWYDWSKRQYNARIIKKLEDLQLSGIKDEEKTFRLKTGEISGFKVGFELIEKLIAEYDQQQKGENK